MSPTTTLLQNGILRQVGTTFGDSFNGDQWFDNAIRPNELMIGLQGDDLFNSSDGLNDMRGGPGNDTFQRIGVYAAG